MNEQKEVVFAALILFAPHISLQLAWWLIGGILVAAILTSDTVGNAVRRIMWHIKKCD